MTNIGTLIVGIVGIFLAQDAAGQTSGSSQPAVGEVEGSRWSVLPLVSYAPETSVQGALTGVYTFGIPDTDGRVVRRSNINLASSYTLKNQFVFSVAPTIYWARWRLAAGLLGLDYPDVFFALGPESPSESAEAFEQRGGQLSVTVERRVIGDLSLGVGVVAFLANVVQREPGGQLASGVEGGNGAAAVGVGPSVVYDSRDREFSPEHGGRHVVSFQAFGPVAKDTHAFAQLILDLRHFVAIRNSSHVIALQAYVSEAYGRPPFQVTPTLAGEGRMRGFLTTRFRDLAVASAQIEYRTALMWRFGGALFAGGGNVASDLSQLTATTPKGAFGAGLRFLLDKNDHIMARLDVGHTNTGDTNLYISVGDAF